MLGDKSSVILHNLLELCVELIYLHSNGSDSVGISSILCHLVVLLGDVVQVCRYHVDKPVYTVAVPLDLGLGGIGPILFAAVHLPS